MAYNGSSEITQKVLIIHSSYLPFSFFNLQFSIFLPRPPVVFSNLLSIKELWNRNAWKTSCKTSPKTSHRPPLTPPVLPSWFSVDSSTTLSHFKCISVLFHRTFLCELTQSLTGGVRWGLWEVLREVLHEVLKMLSRWCRINYSKKREVLRKTA